MRAAFALYSEDSELSDHFNDNQADDPRKKPPASDQLKHRFDKYSGSWVEDPEFDQAMEEFDRVDDEMWD